MLTATAAAAAEGRPCVNRFSGLFALRRFFHPILSGRRKRDRTNNKQVASSNASRSKSSTMLNNSTTIPVDLDLNGGGGNGSIASTSKTRRFFRHSDKSSQKKSEISSTSSAHLEMSTSTEKKFDFIGNFQDPTECPLCLEKLSDQILSNQFLCAHRVCDDCLVRYLCVEIDESRVNLSCPACDQMLHPNVISDALHTLQDSESGSNYVRKYEQFMIRRVLAAEPDARWCPAPDCDYIVIATGCASCPCIRCARPECLTLFCYHCKQHWHPDQTCDNARDQRRNQKRKSRQKSHKRSKTPTSGSNGGVFGSKSSTDLSGSLPGASRVRLTGSKGYAFDSLPGSSSSSRSSYSSYADGLGEHFKNRNDLKPCPCCGVLIIKMKDGSCNHMTCSVCGTEFCWLCLKTISDLHYLSPSGCTFWGKKPWSRKKQILWQLGMLVGAPVAIMLMAGIAVPTIVIGIPVWFGRKLRARLISQSMGRRKRNLLVTSGVISSIVISPLIAAVGIGIGVPVLFAYVYGVIPVTLCRNGGCGLSTTASGVRIEVDEDSSDSSGDEEATTSDHHTIVNLHPIGDNLSLDTALDTKGSINPSIGEFSMTMSQGTNDAVLLDSASTVAVLNHEILTETTPEPPPQGPTAV